MLPVLSQLYVISHLHRAKAVLSLMVYQAMRYLETEFSIRFAPHSLRIKYQSPEATMMIDLSAIASLELIQNLRQARSKDCLFGFLNQTQTPMGTRMLRANILQPYTKPEDIEPRYDALEELSTNEDMYHEVRKGKDDSPFTMGKDTFFKY
jgi:DNA mismatch repair protein MSH4